MPVIFANNAVSLLAASINASVTTLSISAADAARFPTPTGGDWFPLTLFDEAGAMEIMRCTARASTVLTVVRGQEGTAAVSWTAGAGVELRATAASMAALSAPTASAIAFVPVAPTAATNVQAAIEELGAEKAALAGAAFTGAITGTDAGFTGEVTAGPATAPEHVMPQSQSDVRYPFRYNARQDVPTASTVDLAAITETDYINLTGTVQINSFGTGGTVGARYLCRADAVFVLNQGTNVQTPTGADITTEAGDLFEVILEASNVWRVLDYQRATGRPLAGELSAADKIKLDALSTGLTSQRVQLFTSSGSWTVPAGVTRIRATVVGGGGGGAATLDNTNFSAGGPGGVAIGDLTVTPGASLTVTVGAGGAGSNTTNGTAGSTSTFETLSATGGARGTTGTNTAGAAGVGSGGSISNSTTASRAQEIAPYNNSRLPSRANAASSTAAIAFSASAAFMPGAAGVPESLDSSNNSTGGVGGCVIIEWIE